MGTRSHIIAAFACLAALLAAGCASSGGGKEDQDTLLFNPNAFSQRTLTIDGQSISYRAYEGIVYVSKPVDAEYESMNIYIPEAYFSGGSVNGWTAQTAPVFLPNAIGGYMPAKPGTISDGSGEGEGSSSGPNASAYALLRGMVVASPGARGRTQATGKAPAAIVDLKAAVRYLRHNDTVMPGDAEKIVSNGTSAGGALSALLGASGGSSDYAKYLKEIGAADADDSVYAVSAYCPITNLDNADMAYEWMFQGIYDYTKMDISMADYHVQRTLVDMTMGEEDIARSAQLAAAFPSYVNNLSLKDEEGNALTLNKDGTGPFRDWIADRLAESAQKALDEGQSMDGHDWVAVQDGKVTGIDWDGYRAWLGRAKNANAFDAVDLSTPENQEFGTEKKDAQHFTAFSMNNDTAGGSMADPKTVAIMNAMNYTDKKGTAQYWRVRVGTKDADTASAISAMLVLKLRAAGKDVDYFLPWDVPHSGDYDIPELMDWIESVCRD